MSERADAARLLKQLAEALTQNPDLGLSLSAEITTPVPSVEIERRMRAQARRPYTSVDFDPRVTRIQIDI